MDSISHKFSKMLLHFPADVATCIEPIVPVVALVAEGRMDQPLTGISTLLGVVTPADAAPLIANSVIGIVKFHRRSHLRSPFDFVGGFPHIQLDTRNAGHHFKLFGRMHDRPSEIS